MQSSLPRQAVHAGFQSHKAVTERGSPSPPYISPLEYQGAKEMNERESRIIEAIRSTPNPEETLNKVIDIVIDFIEEKKKIS